MSRSSPALPPARYDRAALTPGIVHLGLGGFHRAHLAKYVDDLVAIDPAAARWGIVAAGLRPADRPLVAALHRQDGAYTLVERDGRGEDRGTVGAILRAIDASAASDELLAFASDPRVAIVSLTVTEHGYGIDRATRRLDPYHPLIARDLARPDDPRSAIGLIVAALRRRRDAGADGLTILSCDNMEANGAVTRAATLAYAGAVDRDLADWIAANALFPNSMVDRITPQPTAAMIAELAARTGVDDAAPIMAERFRQWVVEDDFAGERPAWERVGVQFVADVRPHERMKLRLLNASHLALAGPAELAGIASVAAAIGTPAIRAFVEALMARETGPSIGEVPGVDLPAYAASVVERFGNPAIPDTTARINADAPLNYLLDPIADRLASGETITLLALALAAWLRRVRGEDERGRPIAIVHPLAAELRARAIAGGSDAAALLGMMALFGSLGEDPRLRAAVNPWLAMLYEQGALATLEQATGA